MSEPEHAATSLPRWRDLGAWFAFAVCAVLAAIALDALARWQLRQNLIATSAETLGALAHGDTPYRWSMRSPADVIAGRAFGTSDAHFDKIGFRVRSKGEEIEVGLVLTSAPDLQRYPRIEARIDADQASFVAIVLRETFDEPLCSSEAVPVARGASRLSIDIDRLDWTCHAQPASAPHRAAMLRLRFDLSSGAAATIADVRLQPRTPPGTENLAQVKPIALPAPMTRKSFETAFAQAATLVTADAWPVFEIPLVARVEQTLAARDAIRNALPAAILVADGDFPTVAAQAKTWSAPTMVGTRKLILWLGVAVYALMLLGIRFKPPLSPRLRALAELLGAISFPLVLVLSGNFGANIDLPTQAAIGITFAFAASLLIGAAPAQPTSRTLQRGWGLALLSLIIAAGFVVVLRDAGATHAMPTGARVLQYLAWAGIQQFLICVIVAGRLERLLGSSRWALLTAAFIFGLLHTPNAMLMLFTFVGGLIWIWNWQRHRALLANIVAHAACALLLTTQLPIDWLRSAEVSARYFF